MLSNEKKRRILILEDERQLAHAVEEAFVERGFTPTVVSTANEGIQVLENGGTDVIWLDHYLLGAENGVDFVVKLKTNPEWKSIPIFVVSNTASAANVSSYIQLGATNYYTKSDYDIMQIIHDIEYALDQKPPGTP
jgi:two-component system chemotaxis response regulator CheY